MTRWKASVIEVDVAYVNVCILRHLKEELAWVIDKWFRVITNKMSVIPLRLKNKAVLNLKQYCTYALPCDP